MLLGDEIHAEPIFMNHILHTSGREVMYSSHQSKLCDEVVASFSSSDYDQQPRYICYMGSNYSHLLLVMYEAIC